MTVKARLEGSLPPLRCALLFVAAVLAVLFNSAPVAVAVAGVALFEVASRVRVRIDGGGWRPIRAGELLEELAMDELDAWDREQAQAEAQRRAQAQQYAPRW